MKKIITILTLILAVFMGLSNYGVTAFAAESRVQSPDETDVMEDLDGVIDPAAYPADPEGGARLIDEMGFAEYAYSLREELEAAFRVYFYVYNPQKLKFRSEGNVVNISTAYTADGEAQSYTNVALTLLDVSEDGLFCKFKIAPSWSILRMEQDLAAKNGGKRIYKIGGIQLWEEGEKNAVDYPVETTFTCSGFAKGCGSDAEAESTLEITKSGLTTLTLSVDHTFYRTQSSSLGAGHQNQLNTVYFSIPSRYFENGSKLQRIKAEWWEYKTKPMLITGNKELYDAAKPFVGKRLKEMVPGAANPTYYAENVSFGVGSHLEAISTSPPTIYEVYGPSWNLYPANFLLENQLQVLYYLFPTADWGDISEYDPLLDPEDNGGISSNALEKYIYDFESNYGLPEEETSGGSDSGGGSGAGGGGGHAFSLTSDDGSSGNYLPLRGDKKLLSALFEDDIDASRKFENERGKIQKGYSVYDFDADLDTAQMLSWADGRPSFWDNWSNFGFWDALFGKIPTDTGRIVAPIYIVKAEDLAGSDQEIADRLMVQVSEVPKLRERYQSCKGKAEAEELVLFRFATTDYYSEEAEIWQFRDLGPSTKITGQAYFAQETMFFDFDIIQIGMMDKQRTIHIIPVVQSPTDIIPPITPPVDVTPSDNGLWLWWCIVAGAIVIVLMIADGFIEAKIAPATGGDEGGQSI